MWQAAGAGVLRAVPGRGARGRAARVPVAGAQDGALRARAAPARALRAARRRAAHPPRGHGARRAGTTARLRIEPHLRDILTTNYSGVWVHAEQKLRRQYLTYNIACNSFSS